MELIVAGSSAAVPAPGDACAAYLLRLPGLTIVIDCGPGALSHLLAEVTLGEIAAILISHFHPDHYLDLVPLRYALRYGGSGARPRLYLPPGGRDFLASLGVALRGAPDFFAAVFDLAEYDPAAALTLGPLSVRFFRTRHDVPTYAMRIEGSAVVVYSADTAFDPALGDFAAGADLFLCEATLPAEHGPVQKGNHLLAAEAGTLGRAAGADRLVLTHFWPGFDRTLFAREAAETFGAVPELAAPGRRFSVRPS
ncbi:MAG: MBL fold metallo-hydrolase [Chloroflexota bacterium]|nr:MBL fold metallo-hydrolase [Dehalococcoidia bacterium]MDW8255234.1 MBL fold metallo-hydrolase [Chloroflexota bacterium]